MESKKAFELLKDGILKKGCKVKMSMFKGFEEFTEIEDAYIKHAYEIKDDWVVVVIDELMYDAAWIDEIKLNFLLGHTIEECVFELWGYKEKGISVSGEFNGVTLCSDTVTMYNAYMSITGKTKAQCEKDEQDRHDNYKKQEKEHEEKIPLLTTEWIKKGHDILTQDKWAFWDEIVPIRLGDLYQGMELGNCLDIIQILNNNGTLDDAKHTIESQNHSGMSYGLVCSMVKEFCARGNEFIKYVE